MSGYEPTLAEIEDPLRERIAVLEADLKVAKSRADAYQATCIVQGNKLLDIEKVLQLAETSASNSTPMQLRSFKNPFLEAIRKLLIRKET